MTVKLSHLTSEIILQQMKSARQKYRFAVCRVRNYNKRWVFGF
jgi:hypothetical protein